MGRRVTFQDLWNKATRLRNKRDNSEHELMLFLVEVERAHLSLLRQNGMTMAKFSENFVSWNRYASFRDTVGKVGSKVTKSVGVEAAIQAAYIDDELTRDEYLQAMAGWAKDKGRVASRQTAEQKRRTMAPNRTKKSRATLLAEEVDRLKAENRQLKDELKRVKAENAKLRRLCNNAGMRITVMPEVCA